MRDRLDKFMKTEGLSPSRFAEIMGVQPSSISHILGGRNKPSFDFIEKILLRFPKVNPDWLLLGKGTMYRSMPDPIGSTQPVLGADSGSAPVSVPVTTTIPSTLFDTSSASTSRESHKNNVIGTISGTDDSGDNSSEAKTEELIEEPITVRNTVKPSGSGKRPAESVRTAEVLAGVPQHEIERIVIFLKDKTFIAYIPGE